jgi:hypothetical protein
MYSTLLVCMKRSQSPQLLTRADEDFKPPCTAEQLKQPLPMPKDAHQGTAEWHYAVRR